jgi:hypothetical protein
MFLALVVGTGVLLISVFSYGIVTALNVRLLARLIRTGFTGVGFWESVAVMLALSLVTAAAHLTQIALWASVYLLCGEIDTVEKSFYYSAENYTALGYGDIVLSDRWRILGPLEAINGLLLFGLSTALMFAVMSRRIAGRLHLHSGNPGQADVEPPPISVSGIKPT